MAYDKAVDSTQLDAGLTEIANAIRTKGGTEEQLIFPGGFASAIQAITTGGGAGVDIVITSTITNPTEFANVISNSTGLAQYVFAVKAYKNGVMVNNQALCGAVINNVGCGIRYRDGAYNPIYAWSDSYDFFMTIGDIYTIWEIGV